MYWILSNICALEAEIVEKKATPILCEKCGWAGLGIGVLDQNNDH